MLMNVRISKGCAGSTMPWYDTPKPIKTMRIKAMKLSKSTIIFWIITI